MKMSDVFELPLELRSDLVHFTKTDTCYFKVESVNSRDEELSVTYILHQAINNHDKLVEFVESVLGVDYRHGGSLGNDGQFYYKVPESIFDKAERILKELGHEV